MHGRTEQKRMHWQGCGAWQKGPASTAPPVLRSSSSSRHIDSKHRECPPHFCLLPAIHINSRKRSASTPPDQDSTRFPDMMT